MNKIVSAALAAAAVMLSASAAAEDYLFPTDIVPVGESDLDATIATTQARYDFVRPSGAVGTRDFDTVMESATVRAGIVDNLHAGVTLPYTSVSKDTDSINGTTGSRSRSGFDDMDLWIRYRFINNRDFALAGTLGILPNSAGRQNDWRAHGGLAAGWVVTPSARAYVSYAAVIASDSADRSSHTIAAGAYVAQTDAWTWVPSVHYRYLPSDDTLTTQNQAGLDLAAHWAVARATEIIPGVGYAWWGSDSNGRTQFGSTDYVWSATLSIYHVFGGRP